jgi:tetratricopeptide (TPR) repeat protein
MGICPFPLALVGLGMLAGGIYTLLGVKKIAGGKAALPGQAGVAPVPVPLPPARPENPEAPPALDPGARKAALLARATNIHPKWKEAFNLDRAGNIEKARELYLKIIQECPEAISAYNNLAHSYILQGDYQKAQEYAEKADCKFYTCGRTNMGVLLYMQEHKLESIEAFKDGHSFHGLSNLCLVYTELGKYEDAIHAGEEALKETRDNPIIYANLSDAYLKAGQEQKAGETWQTGLKIVGKKSMQRGINTMRDVNLVVMDPGSKLMIQIGMDNSMFTMSTP